MDYAHQCGMEVWALVDNFDQNVDDMELLSHTSSRENLENQLVNAALQNGIDGINVDFEQIPTDVGDHSVYPGAFCAVPGEQSGPFCR